MGQMREHAEALEKKVAQVVKEHAAVVPYDPGRPDTRMTELPTRKPRQTLSRTLRSEPKSITGRLNGVDPTAAYAPFCPD